MHALRDRWMAEAPLIAGLRTPAGCVGDDRIHTVAYTTQRNTDKLNPHLLVR